MWHSLHKHIIHIYVYVYVTQICCKYVPYTFLHPRLDLPHQKKTCIYAYLNISKYKI